MVKKTLPKINHHLLEEVNQALKELGGWGSVEIYVQDGKVYADHKKSYQKDQSQP